MLHGAVCPAREREFFIDKLLVRIHFIIVMIRRTGLAPWEFEFPFPGSLTSTFLGTALWKMYEDAKQPNPTLEIPQHGDLHRICARTRLR